MDLTIAERALDACSNVTDEQARREIDERMKNQWETNEHLREQLSTKERKASDVELKLTNSEETVSRVQRELNSFVADLKQANEVILIYFRVYAS